ncbi:hypothetical protein ACFL1I_07455 [Candidatus Omnitrophota bacterium]
MKAKGIILLLAGVLGAIFVSTYDMILGKEINDITGPKSIPALIICAVFIAMGARFILRKAAK